jgi:hypothetical protein
MTALIEDEPLDEDGQLKKQSASSRMHTGTAALQH